MSNGADMKQDKRIGILISGRGSNMIALADALADGRITTAVITVVISDQPGAGGLVKARERGIETLVIERAGRKRADHDREILAVLKTRQVDLVCLAGYMRVLSPEFIAAYRGRILNIHPSLLPAFPGLDAQRQALENGAERSGCTVHYVDETLDGGPIVAQRVVPIQPGDTVASLSARILIEEHRLYPEAVSTVLESISAVSVGA